MTQHSWSLYGMDMSAFHTGFQQVIYGCCHCGMGAIVTSETSVVYSAEDPDAGQHCDNERLMRLLLE